MNSNKADSRIFLKREKNGVFSYTLVNSIFLDWGGQEWENGPLTG